MLLQLNDYMKHIKTIFYNIKILFIIFYMEYIIKKTTVWGDYHKAKSAKNIRRLYKKLQILQKRPIIDHLNDGGKFVYKPKTQKGPAKESQTFIISYAYKYDGIDEDLKAFENEVKEIELGLYKEECSFRNKDAYKIIIFDTDVNITKIIELLK
jgi:hypothetical protein